MTKVELEDIEKASYVEINDSIRMVHHVRWEYIMDEGIPDLVIGAGRGREKAHISDVEKCYFTMKDDGKAMFCLSEDGNVVELDALECWEDGFEVVNDLGFKEVMSLFFKLDMEVVEFVENLNESSLAEGFIRVGGQ